MDKQDNLRPDDLKSAADTNSHAGKPAAQEEAPLTVREWWIQNGPVLTIVAALLVFLFIKFDSEGLWAIAKAALGLSFVVFIHELGHFLVAKWCDVHVTAFSIGFGPAIPGCWFKWGETSYKLALFPLGGYVQMVGQVDGDEASDGSEDDPRSFRNKSVGARMAIISAGVIMNVILAIVCFVVVYQGPGKDRDHAVVGVVDTWAPAFKYGIRSGDEFVQIGSIHNPNFEDLRVAVMSTASGQELDFFVKRPGVDKIIHYKIEPRLERGDKHPVIGIAPSYRPQLAARRYVDSSIDHPVSPFSAAAQASEPFEFGDQIIGTTDPDNPQEIKELPEDPRLRGQDQRDYFEFMRRLSLLAGKDITIRVRRGPQEQTKTVDIKVPAEPSFHRTLGVRMEIGHVVSVRAEPGKAPPDIHVPVKNVEGDYLEGDLIQKVEVVESDGTVTRYEKKTLDPERLPWQLRQWANRLDQAKAAGPRQVAVWVRRHRAAPRGEQYETKKVDLTWDDSWRFDQAIPITLSSPLAIPELGIAYQIKTTVAEVTAPVQSQPDQLQAGDTIKKIRVSYQDGKGEKITGTWSELEPNQWAHPSLVYLASPGPVKSITLVVERNKKPLEIEVTPDLDRSWPIADRGLLLMHDVRRQKASNVFDAVALGLKDTQNNMFQVFMNIRQMITGRVSVENLGGPVTIARVAYRFAYMDFWEFIFFLGLISVNLAVINFLPIPVLDGGHMVFLLYEKVRGKPASEAIRIGATYAGLALILCLMVFVLYLDFSRLF